MAMRQNRAIQSVPLNVVLTDEKTQPEAVQPDESRFRDLLERAAWARLPQAIRNRFSKPIGANRWKVYRGRVVYTRFSWGGWLLAQVCRVIGAPLALSAQPDMPALVAVCERAESGSQIWTRIYGRPGQFHQVIQSEKRFRGATGLEEYVGYGIGMALRLQVEQEALIFRSAYYFFQTGDLQICLPRWLFPDMLITHREEPGNEFSFSLTLGRSAKRPLIEQFALFSEEE